MLLLFHNNCKPFVNNSKSNLYQIKFRLFLKGSVKLFNRRKSDSCNWIEWIVMNFIFHPQWDILQMSQHFQTQSGPWRASWQHRASRERSRHRDPCHWGQTHDGRSYVHMWPVRSGDLPTSKTGIHSCYHLIPVTVVVCWEFFIMSSSCPSDPVSLLHAHHHVSQPRVRHQQIRRSPLPADQRLQVCQIPGAAYSGTCEDLHYNSLTHCCRYFTELLWESKFPLYH